MSLVYGTPCIPKDSFSNNDATLFFCDIWLKHYAWKNIEFV